MTFCFHLSFSLSLFISTFSFLKVWLKAASGRRVHFRFLWLWLPQLGDMTDGRDRGNGPLSIHLPSSSNFGPGGKTPNTRFATLYCQIHAPKFKIQQKHCVHGWHPSQPCHSCLPQTPAPEVKLGQSFDKVIRKCIGLEQPNISSWRISFGPDFSWDAGLTFSTYLSEVVCKWFLLFLPLQRGSLFFSIARL